MVAIEKTNIIIIIIICLHHLLNNLLSCIEYRRQASNKKSIFNSLIDHSSYKYFINQFLVCNNLGFIGLICTVTSFEGHMWLRIGDSAEYKSKCKISLLFFSILYIYIVSLLYLYS